MYEYQRHTHVGLQTGYKIAIFDNMAVADFHVANVIIFSIRCFQLKNYLFKFFITIPKIVMVFKTTG